MGKNKIEVIPEEKKMQIAFEEARKLYLNSKKNLKRKKTELLNLENNIKKTTRDIPNMFLQLTSLKQKETELNRLLSEVKKLKGLKKREKSDLIEFVQSFFDNSLPDVADMFGQNFDPTNLPPIDENTNRSANIFQEFVVQPPKEEQQNIRKLYLRLAEKFHPDKAQNQEEADKFHGIMQNINSAYKRFDYEELNQMLIDSENSLEIEKPAVEKSLLEQQIETLNNQTEYIKNQINRINAQIKNTKKSDLGENYNNLKPFYESTDFDDLINSTSLILQLYDLLIEFLNDTIVNNKIDESKLIKINSFLDETMPAEPQIDDTFDMESILRMMSFDSDDDLSSFFNPSKKKGKATKKSINTEDILLKMFEEEFSRMSRPKKKKR